MLKLLVFHASTCLPTLVPVLINLCCNGFGSLEIGSLVVLVIPVAISIWMAAIAYKKFKKLNEIKNYIEGLDQSDIDSIKEFIQKLNKKGTT